ncbi:uncharacterized protein METZ01_LOCUS235304, partial [marine metagenome]
MATPSWLDTPGPIRPGEEIDQERLRSYLLTVLPHLEDQRLRLVVASLVITET